MRRGVLHMSRPTPTGDDRPSMRDPTLTGLEIFLTGTPTELDAAARVLGRIGRILYASPRHRLTGADAGRWRVYARLAVPAAAPVPAPTGTGDQPDTLPGLAA
jgi:hypothetical protein